eukprot:3850079-Prorocentrum_lima.AAC.1
MTSSLVGSEMCIRDRLNAAGLLQMAQLDEQQGRIRWARRFAARCIGAVSYTHLTLPTICSV